MSEANTEDARLILDSVDKFLDQHVYARSPDNWNRPTNTRPIL